MKLNELAKGYHLKGYGCKALKEYCEKYSNKNGVCTIVSMLDPYNSMRKVGTDPARYFALDIEPEVTFATAEDILKADINVERMMIYNDDNAFTPDNDIIIVSPHKGIQDFLKERYPDAPVYSSIDNVQLIERKNVVGSLSPRLARETRLYRPTFINKYNPDKHADLQGDKLKNKIRVTSWVDVEIDEWDEGVYMEFKECFDDIHIDSNDFFRQLHTMISYAVATGDLDEFPESMQWLTKVSNKK